MSHVTGWRSRKYILKLTTHKKMVLGKHRLKPGK
jgi:hypothetical protein